MFQKMESLKYYLEGTQKTTYIKGVKNYHIILSKHISPNKLYRWQINLQSNNVINQGTVN